MPVTTIQFITSRLDNAKLWICLISRMTDICDVVVPYHNGGVDEALM